MFRKNSLLQNCIRARHQSYHEQHMGTAQKADLISGVYMRESYYMFAEESSWRKLYVFEWIVYYNLK